jgi:SOS-response transcriptional repressor LexA
MTQTEHGQMKRQEILDFIISYITLHGYPPSIREIGKGVGLKSTSTVHRHILKMLDDGMIETDVDSLIGGTGSPRAIRVPNYKFVKE